MNNQNKNVNRLKPVENYSEHIVCCVDTRLGSDTAIYITCIEVAEQGHRRKCLVMNAPSAPHMLFMMHFALCIVWQHFILRELLPSRTQAGESSKPVLCVLETCTAWVRVLLHGSSSRLPWHTGILHLKSSKQCGDWPMNLYCKAMVSTLKTLVVAMPLSLLWGAYAKSFKQFNTFFPLKRTILYKNLLDDSMFNIKYLYRVKFRKITK